MHFTSAKYRGGNLNAYFTNIMSSGGQSMNMPVYYTSESCPILILRSDRGRMKGTNAFCGKFEQEPEFWTGVH